MNHTSASRREHSQSTVSVRWFDWPAIASLIILALVVFAQFFTRYVLNDSWTWTEELSRYLLMAVVFCGGISVVARNEHIRLEVVESRADQRNFKAMRFISLSLSLVYSTFLGLTTILLALDSTQNLISLPIPKAAVYTLVAISLLASAAISLRQYKCGLRQPTTNQGAETP